MSLIRRVSVYVVLLGVYGFTWLIAVLGGILPRRSWKPTGRIMVTGTFDNPNWYLSHITPLSHSGVEEVILVVDEPQLPLEKVTFVCPPKWVARLLSRAGAKAIWMILAGLRYRPDLYMGYHIAPGGCTALVAGKMMGRPACYQMTGGPVEILGGGFQAGDSLGRFLGHPSKIIETVALRVVHLFDLLVVRGKKAREFLATQDIKGTITVITGSVQSGRQLPRGDRDIHLVFVGRLAPTKQVDQFIAIVAAVSRIMPTVRAVIVGDGPLLTDLKAQADRLGVADRIEFLGKREDVTALLARSQVFVLTSVSEGLSIAMVEAMAAGAVPVVANVGELGDLVTTGVNGYLIRPDCIAEYVDRITPLLQDDVLWERCSHMAMEAAKEYCDLEVVSQKWRRQLQEVIVHTSGIHPSGVSN